MFTPKTDFQQSRPLTYIFSWRFLINREETFLAEQSQVVHVAFGRENWNLNKKYCLVNKPKRDSWQEKWTFERKNLFSPVNMY